MPPKKVIPVPFCVTEPVPEIFPAKTPALELAKTRAELLVMEGIDMELEFPPKANVPEEMVAFLVTSMPPVSMVVPLPIWLMAMPLDMFESKLISLLWFKFSVPLSF